MPERKLRVFLCHSSQDKPVVRELYKKLAAEGWIDPWLDEEELLPGQDWDMEIEKAVETSDAVIVCLSNNSVTKEGYVQRELKFVLDIALEKPEGVIFIIPLRLDVVQPPRRLRSWQYVDFFPKEQRRNSYKRLITSLKIRANDLGIAITLQAETAPETQEPISEQKAIISSGTEAGDKKVQYIMSQADVAVLQEIMKAEMPRSASVFSADMLKTERQRQAFALLSQMNSAEAIAYLRQLTPEGMVLIPAGEFPMGSGRFKNESPQTKVWVNSFYIARFPVTNGEYRLFMLDGGYSRLECWTQAGWNWLQANRRSSPWRWNNESWQTKFDHPVEWLSWYEAMAYARWIALRKRAPYRLPTEAEWEKAASWDEHANGKREFPWGNQFDGALCNLGNQFGTKPCGYYSPAGDSYYGVADLVGQIWQWTSSLRMPYPYRVNDGREDPDALGERVFRGGCWANHDSGFVRCESRYLESKPVWPDMNTNGDYEGPCGLRLVLGVLDQVGKDSV